MSLAKGGKIDLTKGNPGLDNILVGLGWDVSSLGEFDLDTEVFLLDASKKVVSSKHVVFYNQQISPDGAVKHHGDNRTGVGQGDDETISIKLSKVSPEVERILFTATIHEANTRRQNFGQVMNAYIRVLDEANGQELVRFDLSEDYSTSISLVVGEVYRHNGEWKFGALGNGSTQDLSGLFAQYGVL
ncbi:TerD family protein (plasmid) [Aneurinibacillus sp. Ricciae_BoGa-3]|uniref:TerD family protein n=1 Tax=Aneurinibacillus sp. Ricciae_BoGa-3 TaxID=3022697 RepID=UPI002340B48C|nr:TerD family protein [Aneurinibacillus sp. Ricciae_BoGa-3]WCK57772.1 TerD family protein [Aneurinibacillus sp. Ricciae_BoGa-3]